MRKKIIQIPNRTNLIKTAGSNTFTSKFKTNTVEDGIVEKSTAYNWLNYKMAIGFTLVIGSMTYFLIDYLFF